MEAVHQHTSLLSSVHSVPRPHRGLALDRIPPRVLLMKDAAARKLRVPCCDD